jgi:DNA-binding CsgD family transcriptional regulator
MRDDDLGAAARAELAGTPLQRIVAGRTSLLIAEAIACGRAGDRQAAEERFSQAHTLRRHAPVGLRFGTLLERYAAEAAVRDGWGQPAELLRELAAYYAAAGYDRLARACRALLAETGAPVPRRGRGDSVVPPQLRAIGVTSRELDVLKLLVAGRTNREIGERLYLSTRTVDNHVASLLRRTGAADRAELAAMGLVG